MNLRSLRSRALAVLALLVLLLLGAPPQVAAIGEQSEIDQWKALLKPKYFVDRPLVTGKLVVELRIPLRAEDAGVVPVSVNARIQQTPERYIAKLYVFVDKNPKPLAGLFHLTPAMGRADLALRLRFIEFTKVRVVAETNTGERHMDEGYSRASGGCSEPPPFLKLKEARARIGEMKFRTVETDDAGAARGQLIIKHPNITGLQLDQRTRALTPAEYVTRVEISFNGEHFMTAETDISLSEEPSFGFYFRPRQGGTIEAGMTDSQGREVTHRFEVAPDAAPG